MSGGRVRDKGCITLILKSIMATTPSGGTPVQNVRQRARVDSEKLDMVLKNLEDVKWSPS